MKIVDPAPYTYENSQQQKVDGYPERRAILYDSQEDVAYIAPKRSTHQGIHNALGHDYDMDRFGYWERDPERDGLIHWSGLENHPDMDIVPKVDTELAKYFGDKLDPDWHFSSTGSRLEWEPGTKGKGWVAENGTIHTWSVGDDLRPFHMEKARGLGSPTLKIKDDQGWVRDSGAFHISEDGSIHRMGAPLNPTIVEHVLREDPRLKDPDNDWTF